MAEWLKAAVLKTAKGRKPFVGSNPTRSVLSHTGEPHQGAMKILRFAVGAIAIMMVASCKKSGTEPATSGVITVIITPSAAAVKPGQQVQLQATVAGPPGIPTTVAWRSNDPQYATVSGTGLVTGIAEGAASIRASWTEDPEEFSIAIITVTSTRVAEAQPTTGARAAARSK